MFFASLTPVEQQHLIDAYTFELAKCYEQPIKERQLLCLAQIDSSLAAAVAAGLGLPAPASPSDLPKVQPSPALSQVGKDWPVTGRNIGVLVGAGSDLAQVRATIAAIDAQGMLPLVIADTGGKLGQGTANEVTVQRTLLSTRSVEFDAIIVADGRQPSPKSVLLVNEAYRHAKALAAWGTGAQVLGAAGCPPEAPGVVLAAGPGEAVEGLLPLLSKHRVWERPTPSD
jgi:catalase